MAILELSSDAPQWAKLAADSILYLHIAGGGLGIVMGTAALLLPKGGRLHRTCGSVFFVAMGLAFGIGACVAPFLDTGQPPNFIAGVFAFYLLVSSWLTIKYRDISIAFNIAGITIALGTAVAGAVFIYLAKNNATGTIDGAPPQSFYIFLILGAAASIDDFIVILRRKISHHARLARHLWRMCAALFFATGSFFLGQPQVFPEYLRGSPILSIPVFLPLLVMVFWLLRISLRSWRARNSDSASRATN
ncbi:MAG: hypothetical protein EOO68_31890 [Moraxellaceae bacterium]|nr:MAG: hypothetical protein EOO68_31890 [Moraxellaceae bacterium]